MLCYFSVLFEQLLIFENKEYTNIYFNIVSERKMVELV